ncbi:MAG: hypothetical protein ACOYJH_04865 [Anaerovoracaceae bacterium]|jgi:hypothetical protein
MERKINVRNGVIAQQALAENRETEKGRLNSGAFVSFIAALLAALGASVVAAPAAVTAYLVLAIVSGAAFEVCVDREISKAKHNEKA